MIRSSPDRGPVRGGTLVGAGHDVCDWPEFGGVHADLEHHPVDQAQLEVLRVQELEVAYRRGRADGEQAAHARAHKEVETAVSAARRALQQVRESSESWHGRLEENLVALSTAIARQIIERELKGDAQTFRSLVRQAVAAFPLDHGVKVRLHPSDLAMLSQAGGGPEAGDTDGRETRWMADEDMVPGGCIVEGPDRIVDGRVDGALERVYWEVTRG